MSDAIIVINPGSTSTKFALWGRDGCIIQDTVRHETNKLATDVYEQLEYRKTLIDEALLPKCKGLNIVATVGRGGLLKPLKGGTYLVNQQMLEDLKMAKLGKHASNLGAPLANLYALQFDVSAYIVDPVTVDEFSDLARLSGVKWLQRQSRSHALNIRAVSRRASDKMRIPFNNIRLVVAHLGGGTSIAAVDGGKIVDVNDALLGMGPYSPERAGALPIGGLVEKCYSGEFTKKEMIEYLSRKSGLMSYCGDADMRILLERAETETDVKLAIDGMIYQTAKEIGAMATVLHGKLDAIVITGGIAYSEYVIKELERYIAYLGQVLVFPGEGELEALAEGAFRVVDNKEKAMAYA